MTSITYPAMDLVASGLGSVYRMGGPFVLCPDCTSLADAKVQPRVGPALSRVNVLERL